MSDEFNEKTDNVPRDIVLAIGIAVPDDHRFIEMLCERAAVTHHQFDMALQGQFDRRYGLSVLEWWFHEHNDDTLLQRVGVNLSELAVFKLLDSTQYVIGTNAPDHHSVEFMPGPFNSFEQLRKDLEDNLKKWQTADVCGATLRELYVHLPKEVIQTIIWPYYEAPTDSLKVLVETLDVTKIGVHVIDSRM